MTESFEEMKARFLKQMLEMHQTIPQPVTASQSRPAELPAQSEPPQQAVIKEMTVTEKQPVISTDKPAPAALSESLNRETAQAALSPDREPGDTGQGYMIIWAATADEALPVPDAEVVITRMIDGRRTLQAVGVTDQSGRTPQFALPAPSASMSQSPNNPTPFARYDVSVRADGFAHARYTNIPVFDGIQSVQRADLVPVSANSGNVVVDEQSDPLSQPPPQDGFGKEGDAG